MSFKLELEPIKSALENRDSLVKGCIFALFYESQESFEHSLRVLEKNILLCENRVGVKLLGRKSPSDLISCDSLEVILLELPKYARNEMSVKSYLTDIIKGRL